jgi:hypothetical protein
MLSRASIVSFIEIALIVAAFLNLEMVWQTVANYSFLELESYTSLLQVFGGLALGKVFGILFCREWNRSQKLLVTMGSICLAWLGFLFVPALSFVWLTVPFIGFGVLFVDLFSNEPLRRLIIVSGLVGAIYFAAFSFVTGVVAEWLILLSLALLLACVALTAKLRVSLSGLGLLLIIGSLLHLGYLTIPSQFDRHVARFTDAQPVAPPEVNLLFRTDLTARASWCSRLQRRCRGILPILLLRRHPRMTRHICSASASRMSLSLVQQGARMLFRRSHSALLR